MRAARLHEIGGPRESADRRGPAAASRAPERSPSALAVRGAEPARSLHHAGPLSGDRAAVHARLGRRGDASRSSARASRGRRRDARRDRSAARLGRRSGDPQPRRQDRRDAARRHVRRLRRRPGAERLSRRPRTSPMPRPPRLPLAGLTAYRAAFTRGRLSPQRYRPDHGDRRRRADVRLALRRAPRRAHDRHLGERREAGAREGARRRRHDQLQDVARLAQGSARSFQRRADARRRQRRRGDALALRSRSRGIGARIVIYGGTTGNATIRPFPIFWKHLTILGTSMGSPADFAGPVAARRRGAAAAGRRPRLPARGGRRGGAAPARRPSSSGRSSSRSIGAASPRAAGVYGCGA